MGSFTCTRCHKEISGGYCFDFGHVEIFGQLLGQTCAECSWGILCEYKSRAEDLEQFREDLMKDLRALVYDQNIPRLPA